MCQRERRPRACKNTKLPRDSDSAYEPSSSSPQECCKNKSSSSSSVGSDLLISNPVIQITLVVLFRSPQSILVRVVLCALLVNIICSDIAEAGDLDSDNSGVTVLDVNCVVERKGRSVSPLTVSSDTMEEGDSVEINASEGTGLSHSDLTRILSSLASGLVRCILLLVHLLHQVKQLS